MYRFSWNSQRLDSITWKYSVQICAKIGQEIWKIGYKIICAHNYVCVYVCVCVCMNDRQWDDFQEIQASSNSYTKHLSAIHNNTLSLILGDKGKLGQMGEVYTSTVQFVISKESLKIRPLYCWPTSALQVRRNSIVTWSTGDAGRGQRWKGDALADHRCREQDRGSAFESPAQKFHSRQQTINRVTQQWLSWANSLLETHIIWTDVPLPLRSSLRSCGQCYGWCG